MKYLYPTGPDLPIFRREMLVLKGTGLVELLLRGFTTK
jgi:hypothetical protein